MKSTTNYGLKKPDVTDFYNVDVQNENMDIIDAKLKELEEGGGGDTSTAGYNEETDSLWVMKNGEKVDVLKLYTERYYFIKDGLNYGNLHIDEDKVYGNRPTIITEDDVMIITLYPKASDGGNLSSSELIFDEIDLTNFDRIVMSQISTTPMANQSYNNIVFGVRDSLGNALTTNAYIKNATSSSGEVALDVTNIEGRGTVFLNFSAYAYSTTSATTIKIAYAYVE